MAQQNNNNSNNPFSNYVGIYENSYLKTLIPLSTMRDGLPVASEGYIALIPMASEAYITLIPMASEAYIKLILNYTDCLDPVIDSLIISAAEENSVTNIKYISFLENIQTYSSHDHVEPKDLESLAKELTTLLDDRSEPFFKVINAHCGYDSDLMHLNIVYDKLLQEYKEGMHNSRFLNQVAYTYHYQRAFEGLVQMQKDQIPMERIARAANELDNKFSYLCRMLSVSDDVLYHKQMFSELSSLFSYITKQDVDNIVMRTMDKECITKLNKLPIEILSKCLARINQEDAWGYFRQDKMKQIIKDAQILAASSHGSHTKPALRENEQYVTSSSYENEKDDSDSEQPLIQSTEPATTEKNIAWIPTTTTTQDTYHTALDDDRDDENNHKTAESHCPPFQDPTGLLGLTEPDLIS